MQDSLTSCWLALLEGISDFGLTCVPAMQATEATVAEGMGAGVAAGARAASGADEAGAFSSKDPEKLQSREAGAPWERKGWAITVALVEEMLRVHAPVHGIVGFSEGSAVAVLIALKQQRELQRGAEGRAGLPRVLLSPSPPSSSPPPPPPLAFIVSVASFAMDVPALAHKLLGVDVYEEPLLIPTLHVVGAQDALTLARSDARSAVLRLLEGNGGGGGGGSDSGGGGGPSGGVGVRGGRSRSAVSMWLARLPLMYAQPTTLLHRGGHGFPSAGGGRSKLVVSSFLERQVEAMARGQRIARGA
jgi:hypothetical protein